MDKNYSCNNCLNAECFLKKGCTEDWLNILSEKKRTAFYRKGQHVFHEESRVLGLFFVMSGSVKVYSTGINDKIQIVRFAKG